MYVNSNHCVQADHVTKYSTKLVIYFHFHFWIKKSNDCVQAEHVTKHSTKHLIYFHFSLLE
jgi:hypothetical protein